MERISIFNYEAFYLDFLEGNLSEEDAALLMEFLDANPDLKMDEADSLPSFDEEQLVLDTPFKNELKQPGDDEVICSENAEYFMVASAEGLLDETKEAELAAFVAANGLEKDRAYFGAVYFEADPAVTYADKEGLKRKSIVLWPYISVAAAASVIVFFMIWSSTQNTVVDTPGTVTAEESVLPEENNTNDIAPEQVVNNVAVANNDDSADQPEEFNNLIQPQSTNIQNRPNNTLTAVDHMERRPVGNVLADMNNRPIEPIAHEAFEKPVTNNSLPQDDVASAGFNEMKNPIEPITHFVAEKTNTEIDFRSQKKTESKPGGFFLKIGKFELSRKKH